MAKRVEIRPQDGPQTTFLTTEADIAFYGGSAGGGKSYAVLLDPLRWVNVPGCNAIVFRRTMPEIKALGSIWAESLSLYPKLGGVPRESLSDWKFPGGLWLKMAGLEYESDVHAHQSAQYAVIYFEEVTHFTANQFWYMVSRNRSVCGIQPYIRATCNPDPDSFVAELIKWWINQDTGYPIPERSGVIRYFVREGDELVWADTREELEKKYDAEDIRSFTFIASTVDDNKILLEKDPRYKANLKSLPLVERERLLKGNWKIKPAAGLYFKREWFSVVEAVKPGEKIVRYWDRAGTEKKQGNDPDWTVGTKMQVKDGHYTILDVVRFRDSPFKVAEKIKNIASQDGTRVRIGLEQEPGASGKSEVQHLIRQLSGFSAKAFPPKSDKITRAGPLSAQVEAGNVSILRGPWNEEFLKELENFPEGKNDDQVDATSGAFMMLVGTPTPGIAVISRDEPEDDTPRLMLSDDDD